MKTIKLNRLKLTAFKGIKSLEIDFSDETQIFGANGTGKTTVFDAFTWLLFGKDSTDRKDFEIKTLDEYGNAIPKIDHEVEAIIDVDGDLIEIKRVYSEKWVKQKGSETPTFTGHETAFYWNGVPMKQIDFQREINGICDEFVFKLITSPTAFNSLSWKERRGILVQIAGDVSNNEIAGSNKSYLDLIEKLSKYNSGEDYKKMLQASVKKAKEEISVIPSRIDEVEKSKPEPSDFHSLKKQLSEKEVELKTIDEQIENSTKAYQAELDKINEHHHEVNQLKSVLANLYTDAEMEAKKSTRIDTSNIEDLKNKVSSKQKEIEKLKRDLADWEFDIKNDESKIKNISDEMDKKRDEWKTVNAEECKDSTVCPSCQQTLPEDKISEIIERHKNNKAEKMNRINDYGKKLSDEKAWIEKRLEENKVQYTESKKYLPIKEDELKELEVLRDAESEKLAGVQSEPIQMVIEKILSENEEYQSKKTEINRLNENPPTEPKVDNQALKSEKQIIQLEIDNLKIEISKEQQIQKADERIKELSEREKELAQQIADVDKQIFTLEEFTKLKVDEIERRVRGKFSLVSFRMFNEQINGGLEPTCETLIDGVPYSDANTASKLNAGIDIINTLSKFYGVTAPIIVDNRESVTDLIPTDAQIVNLIVSSTHKKLEVQKLSKESLTV